MIRGTLAILVFFLVCNFSCISEISASDLINSHEKFKLIIGLYNETGIERSNEYITCLKNNMMHDSIDEIHVVYDTSKDDEINYLLNYLKVTKVKISYIQERPSFGYFFNLINNYYPDSKVILSNADIYFNETLRLLENYPLANKFLALTRWDVKEDGSIEIFKQYSDSQFL